MIEPVPAGAEAPAGPDAPHGWTYSPLFIDMAACFRAGLDPFDGLDGLAPERRAALVAFERACIRSGVLGYGGWVMLALKVDARRAIARTQAADRANVRAETMRRVLGPKFVRLVRDAPKDTTRYAGGWAQAATAAKLVAIATPAVRVSRFADGWSDRLDDQVARMQKVVARRQESFDWWSNVLRRRYIEKGRQGKWKNDCQRRTQEAHRRLLHAQKLLARAEEERKKFVDARGTAIVMFGGKGRSLKVTVRPTVYGGSGRMIQHKGGVTFFLHNREAHASIVESRRPLLRKLIAEARSAGGIRLARAGYGRVFRVGGTAGV